MTDEINWAKMLGELLADHELRVADRITRAAVLPPELAEQVASAVRLLHESPSIVERSEPPRPSAPARVTRIERDEDGNLVPIYDEPQP
jgi:hypothetical protein